MVQKVIVNRSAWQKTHTCQHRSPCARHFFSTSCQQFSLHATIETVYDGGEGLESLELAHLLVDTILDKKGSDIALLDLREQAVFADYFLICNGENDRQLRAMANGVAQDAKQKGSALAKSIEGSPESGWVLVDFGDLLVHLFSPDMRHFYDLEGLWDDAHVVMRMQ